MKQAVGHGIAASVAFAIGTIVGCCVGILAAERARGGR